MCHGAIEDEQTAEGQSNSSLAEPHARRARDCLDRDLRVGVMLAHPGALRHRDEDEAVEIVSMLASLVDSSMRTSMGSQWAYWHDLSVRVHAVRSEEGELTFVLSSTDGERPELRLGEPADVGLKLAVGALVLRSLSAEERADLAYLDVSLPDRPVAGSKSQLST